RDIGRLREAAKMIGGEEMWNALRLFAQRKRPSRNRRSTVRPLFANLRVAPYNLRVTLGNTAFLFHNARATSRAVVVKLAAMCPIRPRNELLRRVPLEHTGSIRD